jgi:hypothetical protein
MADQETPPPIPSQILAETLRLVEQNEAFEPNVVEALKRLADVGGFREAEQLVEALKNREIADETS